MSVGLSAPPEGIRARGVLLRLPVVDDADALLPGFQDPEMREAGNLPAFGREELAAVDVESDEVIGAGMLHHLDVERQIVEIGYFVLPHARRRGFATTIARALAEHAFSLGVERVAAYVNVDNTASERVLERAGFTREGVVRSMPKPDGRRVDKTLFSLLPGD